MELAVAACLGGAVHSENLAPSLSSSLGDSVLLSVV
jgi:hypothetical protein